jgi:hypothetical protein
MTGSLLADLQDTWFRPEEISYCLHIDAPDFGQVSRRIVSLVDNQVLVCLPFVAEGMTASDAYGRLLDWLRIRRPCEER